MFLYGASGHAKVIIDIVRATGQLIDGVLDDNEAVLSLNEIEVKHHWDGESPIIISIGNNKIRKIISERLDCKFAKAIHPSSILSPSVSIGDGSVVMAGAIINADTTIGCHCIINTGASIDHDCLLGDYVHVSPHATLCGIVDVGEGAWIGAGATVIQGVKIGKWCSIGAGAVVISDIPDNAVVAGVPARIIKYKNNED